MSNTIHFTDTNFEQEVLQSNQPVLVDFWAAWCGPCRAIGPVVEDLAEQYQGSVKVGKVNIDENPQTPGDYGISSIPAVLVFKNGEVVDTLVGVQTKQRYEESLERACA